jgi:hypothetical protein
MVMGAYVYCQNCDAGMSKPKLSDIRDSEHVCQSCGCRNYLPCTKHEALCEFIDDLMTELSERHLITREEW